jgi:hypothetical protein
MGNELGNIGLGADKIILSGNSEVIKLTGHKKSSLIQKQVLKSVIPAKAGNHFHNRWMPDY